MLGCVKHSVLRFTWPHTLVAALSGPCGPSSGSHFVVSSDPGQDLVCDAMAEGVHMCRHVGILEVHVLEGRNMRKMDAIGKSDPWVEVYTQPSHKEKTVRVLPCNLPCNDKPPFSIRMQMATPSKDSIRR